MAANDGYARIQALVVAALIFMTGLGAAWTAMRWVEAEIAAESTERLDRQAGRVRNTIEQQFGLPVYGLRGLRATFAMEGDLTRAQFQAWVASRDLSGEFPGVRAFAYAERVYRWATVRFVERARRDGAPNFEIRSEGDAPDLYVIKFIEPFQAYAPVIGLDIGGEAVRRSAIEAAVETGEAALSGPIGLRGIDGQPTPGHFIVLAVYEGGVVPKTVAERRAAARGVVYAPLVSEDLFAAAAAASDGLVEFDVYDGLPDDTLEPYFRFRAPGSTVPSTGAPPPVRPSFFLPIVVANRLIVLRAWGAPRWLEGIDRTTPKVVGVGVAAAGLGLAVVVWLLVTGRARALALARAMTADLDRLAKVAERTTNGVIITGPDRRIVWVNDGFTRLTGFTAEEAIGRKPRELVQFEGTSTDRDEEIRRCLAEHRPFRGEIRNRAKDGRIYWVDLEIRPMLDHTGAFVGYMAIQTDVTERREAFEQLEAREAELNRAFVDVEEARIRAEVQAMEMTALAEQLAGERQRSDLAHRRLKEAIDSLSDAFCLYDPDERIVMLNPEYSKTYGEHADKVVPGTSYETVVRLGIARGLYPAAAGRVEAFVREHVAEFHNPPPPYEVKSPDGRWYRIDKRLTPSGHMISFRLDISELKAKEAALAKLNAELERLATTDPLTGVPNRRALMERGNAELVRLRRYAGKCAFVALDIDHFKRVNDTYGHAAGDAVLVEFARRVRACLRESDMFGRVGGEEFAVLAPETDADGARLLADRLLEFVRMTPIVWEGRAISITTSAGIAMLDPADADLSAAQGRADDALYRAKHAGRNRFEFA